MKAERVTVEESSRRVDGSVRNMMDNKSIRRTTTVTVGLLSTIWLIDMVDRVMIGLALPMIGDEFSLSSTQLGGVVSVFAIFYMLGQVPVCTCIRQEHRLATQMKSPRSLGL